MFIDPGFYFELEIKNTGRLKLLKETLDPNLKMREKIKVPWYLLQTSSFRNHHMKLKCDDCGTIFSKKLRYLDPSINIHYCGSCFQKGPRHHNYGHPLHENTIIALIEWRKKHENPSKKDEVRKKISEARKGKPSNMLGKTHTEKSRKKISESNKIAIKEAWETGKLDYKSKYADSKMKEYKGIQYQGSYELDFLKECEKIGILDLIERGPVINYYDEMGKNHLYLVDYRIRNSNILIEVKSSYTLGINRKNNIHKFEEAKKLGNFILITNKNYSEFYKKINENGIFRN